MRAVKIYATLFLATAVPFGLLMGAGLGALFSGFGIDDSGLRTGVIGGSVFGLVMAAILGTLQLTGNRGVPRGTSLTPRQQREVPVANGPDLADRIVEALRSLPANIVSVDVPAGRYTARRGTSWKSWGEEVVVQLAGDPARPTATVTSRPRVATTLIDYGRGRRNVEHVVDRLGRQPVR